MFQRSGSVLRSRHPGLSHGLIDAQISHHMPQIVADIARQLFFMSYSVALPNETWVRFKNGRKPPEKIPRRDGY